MSKITNIVLVFCLVFTMPAIAQSPKADINTIRELAIIMQLGFENAEKQRQADKEVLDKRFEYLDKRFAAIDKRFEALERMIQANKEDLDKRIDFVQSLVLAQFSLAVAIVIGLAAYLVWTQNRERELAQKTGKTMSLQEFQKLLKQAQALEQQRV